MNSRIFLVTIFTAALCLAPAAAQPPTPAPEADSTEAASSSPDEPQSGRRRSVSVQQVVFLNHAYADEAADVVRSVLGGVRTGVDDRTNSVVVSGEPEEIDAAARLLAEIDKPVDAPSDSQPLITRLPEGAPSNTIELVEALLGRRTRVAIDGDAGLLVVHGSIDDINKVRHLLETIAQANVESDSEPAEAANRLLKVSFFFIQGRLTGSEALEAGAAAHLPADQGTLAGLDKRFTVSFDGRPLAEVMDEIAKLGDLNIAVKWNDVEGNKIARDTPVTLKLAKEVTLRTILELVLEQVGGHRLGYVVGSEVIKIGTRTPLEQDDGASLRITPLPEALGPAAAALAENGFHQASMLAPLMVQVHHDEHFDLSGTARERGALLRAEVDGRVNCPTNSNVAELEIWAKLTASPPGGGEREGAEPVTLFDIATTLSFKLGDEVVLAASPLPTDYGRLIALAVRVDAAP